MQEYKLDKREVEDIKNKINQLSRSYTPEWIFDENNPDAGSVIALIFAKQMADNIQRYNMVLDRFHTEFVNMLGISLLPAQPASTTVLFRLIQSTIPGAAVPKGTKMYAYHNGTMVVFETEYSAYVTSSVLSNVFMVSGRGGQIIPLLGSFAGIPLLKEFEEEPQVFTKLKPFELFRFSVKGMERNALLIYHRHIFDIEKEDIFIKIKGSTTFFSDYEKGDYELSYYSEEGFLPVEDVEVIDEGFKLRKYHKSNKTQEGYSVLALIAKQPVLRSIDFEEISVSSAGDTRSIEFAGNGTTDLTPGRFAPFGDTLALFAECFLGHEEYFSKAGARITLRFRLDILLHTLAASRQQEDNSLKIIKRRPRIVPQEAPAQARVEEVAIEYFNGSGWRRLICEEDYKAVFAAEEGADITLHFMCPEDWEEQSAFGYQGRLLRMQVLKSDNCYMVPGDHFYPVISDMTVEYSYEGNFEYPDRLEAIRGTKRVDLTRAMAEKGNITGFVPGEYSKNALYMGFDRKFESGPISMLFELEEEVHFTGTGITFEYYSMGEFKSLHTIDRTETLVKTGIIRFIPPEDMTRCVLEGKNCYWIRIVDKDNAFYKENIYYPMIRSITLNCVEVQNVETLQEEAFYMDEVSANREFSLSAGNILNADVWVNEQGSLSTSDMKQLLKEKPEDVQAEYDLMGNIQDFYVRWKEVDHFEDSTADDRHYIIDRMNNSIMFGDGVHVRMPRVTNSIAVKATVRSCNGVSGNIIRGGIEGTLGNVNFIDEATNIFPAYGGSNIESVDSALKRGASILSSRRRLVTQYDFTREVQASSDNVDKVACVIGREIDGSINENMINLVVLMKDFCESTRAFDRLLPRLRKHLCENCELTIDPEQLRIVEPIGVELSIDVWIQLEQEEMDFSIQESFIQGLNDFLNPISGENRNGWQIGIMPRRTQIMMKLNSLKTKTLIRKLMINGRYKDSKGKHECELEDLPANPFFICRSGVHKVHILTGEEFL